MTDISSLPGLPDPDQHSEFYENVSAKRLLAWVIDTGIIILLSFAVVILSLFTMILLFPLLLIVVSVAYRTYFLNRQSATLGMYWLGIEIRNKSGDRLDKSEALYHSALFTGLFIFPILPLVSCVMILVTRYNQGLHDLALGTTAILRPA